MSYFSNFVPADAVIFIVLCFFVPFFTSALIIILSLSSSNISTPSTVLYTFLLFTFGVFSLSLSGSGFSCGTGPLSSILFPKILFIPIISLLFVIYSYPKYDTNPKITTNITIHIIFTIFIFIFISFN